jgi:glycosyltransferase involved in cell wall biosynthesis
MKISVVMPCYNSEKYISFAIESILNQTFSDFEFIIVDDGSTDKSKDIILSYNDERIKYIYQENSGCAVACYRGCKEAIGEYIARMDTDDISEKNRFEEQVRFLNTHPDYILVASACTYIDENGAIIGRSFPYTANSNIKRRLLQGLQGSPIAHPTVMYRKVAYEKSGGYIGVRTGEDFFLWNKMAKFGKYKNIKKCLIKYRKTPFSLCTNIEKEARLLLNKKSNDLIHQTNITDADIKEYNQIYINGKDKSTPKYIGYTRSAEEKMYSFLIPFVGSCMAESLTYFLKNLYGIMRLPSKPLN